MKIAVLGAGAWGTAISINLCPRHELRLWARDAEHVERLRAERVNQRYLPGCPLPPAIPCPSLIPPCISPMAMGAAGVPAIRTGAPFRSPS